ncbi:MAG: YjbH domain-containing protein [Qingshengfaniella sp.]
MTENRRRTGRAAAAVLALTVTSGQMSAQTVLDPALNLYGLPGLVDMPTARMLPDAELSFSAGYFAGMTRGTLSFQITPWLLGSFRYSQIEDWNSGGFDTYYDRSFDLRLRLLAETARLPEISVGLQDFIGTGVYAGEYLVASKTFADRLSVTAGLGWGRLGSASRLGSVGSRPDLTSADIREGGTTHSDRLFRGDVGLFAGLTFQATDKLMLKAEYSSDDYEIEAGEKDLFDRDSPFNFGAEYQVAEGIRLGVYALHGSEIGATAQFRLNPQRPAVQGSFDDRPAPVLVRPARATHPEFYTTDWALSEEMRTDVRDQLAQALAQDGIELEALRLGPEAATVYLRNLTYQFGPQAIGRTARAMARMLPSSIETFTIVPVTRGVELPGATFSRTDVEHNEMQPDGAERMLAAMHVTPTPDDPLPAEFSPGLYPRFSWFLAPNVRTNLFDPDNPLRADLGLGLGARWTPAPGFVFGGTVQKRLIGNLDKIKRKSDSDLPHVRSDFAEYDKKGDPALTNLYGAYYFQPGQDLYGRVTAGYLERMFAGASTELLWAPYDSRFALGAELNYSKQRDFHGGFGLQDYDVVTGALSAYWRVTDDFQAQLDVGRYLARDVGATVSLERVFANGWRLGAFATKTDASAEDFGEGSFDKGITMTIPVSWILRRSIRAAESFTIRPLTRDGGGQLSVPGRLYPMVEDTRRHRQEDQWGWFWR